MDPLMLAVYVGTMSLTSYRSVPAQTDDSPYITSIGHHVHPYGVAVSRDLLANGKACYGDALVIKDVRTGKTSIKLVNDCMAKRHKNAIDLWVGSYPEEKAVGRSKAQVWVLRSPERRCKK